MMVNKSSKTTDTTQVYRLLRNDIITGVLLPDVKLQIKEIAQRYGTGVNPVREALNRLLSEGVVEHRDRRGFFSPSIHIDELRIVVKTRCWLEGIAIRESIANGDQTWEERIVISFHRLAKRITLLSQSGLTYVGDQEWESLHRAFHIALIEGCDSSWLLKYCRDLMDHAHRYRRLSDTIIHGDRDIDSEHKGIMDAVIARDTALAIARLEEHYSKTFQVIEKNLPTNK